MFVCDACKEPEPNRYRHYRERIEYVRLDGRKRAYVKTLRLVCQDCVERIARGGVDAPPTLFPQEEL